MRKSKILNQLITPESSLIIERLTPTGQGIATAPDGIKIFLWNALPGEEVSEYRVTKKKSHHLEAIATKFSKTSSDRIEPRDSHFLSTSPWQIMSEDTEVQAKESLLSEIFRDLPLPHNRPIRLTPSPNNYFYRNKMEYALYFDKEDEKIHLAVHARGSHRKIPIASSSIERPEIFARASEIIDELNANHDEARRYQSLLLRTNQSGEVSGGLYENGRPHPTFPNLTDTILGHEYSYSPNGFFQINLPVYELALKRIKELIESKNHIDQSLKVLDLYAGVGTIGLSVAREADLTLVEVDRSAYQELERNVSSISETTNITPVLAKSEEALEYITPDSVVIVDPPRAGCDDKLIQKLLAVHPRQIIYLSCNPATQARDLEKLLAKYHLDSIEAFNFFPRTPHIESLISLS